MMRVAPLDKHTTTRRFVTFAGAAAACVLIGACSILAPKCGSPQRLTSASGRFPTGASSVDAVLSASFTTLETREGGGVTERTMWDVLGISLKPHVTKIELRDAADGALLFSIPVNGPPAGVIIASSLGPKPAQRLVSFNHLRRRVRERQTIIEVTTTLPDQPLLRVALTNVNADRDFERPTCDSP